MRYLLIILFTLSFFPYYAFDRSKNILLYDEAITPRQTVYMPEFAIQGGRGSSGGSSGGSGSALAADAQPSYSKPIQFGEMSEITHPGLDCSLKWVGNDENGYIEATSSEGETFKVHPPDGAEYVEGEWQSGWSWTEGDGTNYEILVRSDASFSVYQRPPDDPGGFWAYESQAEDTYVDIPDAVKGYIQLME